MRKPAINFDAGGIGDAVEHMKTGYLARYKENLQRIKVAFR